jgi:TRAP-type C4-dicarboxylate transport system permease small subunit
VTASTTPTGNHPRAFWALRAVETGLLLLALVGIALFAWSIVDIVRIETGVWTEAAPPGAWPGILLCFGSLLLLQPVRAILVRYRRDDGTQRGDARDEAVKATASALASIDDDPGPVGETTVPQAEG